MPSPTGSEDEDFGIAELVPQYLAFCRSDLEVLRAALAGRDFEKIRILGHNLKGSGSAYGFPEITEYGSLLEQAGKNSDNAGVEQGISLFSQFLCKHVEAG